MMRFPPVNHGPTPITYAGDGNITISGTARSVRGRHRWEDTVVNYSATVKDRAFGLNSGTKPRRSRNPVQLVGVAAAKDNES
jgi:hypothetical protein